MRCLQKFPYWPAGHEQSAVRLSPSLMNVTSYGSADEPFTNTISSFIFNALRYEFESNRLRNVKAAGEGPFSHSNSKRAFASASVGT